MEQLTKEKSDVLYTVVATTDTVESVAELLNSIFSDPESAKAQVILAVCDIEEDMYQTMGGEYADRVDVVGVFSTDIYDVYAGVRDIVKGEYVTFITGEMRYEDHTFSAIVQNSSAKSANMFALKPVYVNPANEKIDYIIAPQEEGMCVPVDDISQLHLFFSAAFFKKAIVDELGFEKTVPVEKERDFLMRYYLKYNEFYYLKGKVLYYFSAAEDQFATNLIQYRKEWYLDDAEQFLLKWAEASVDYELNKKEFIQTCVFYSLFSRYDCNSNDRNKKIIENEELEQFRDCSSQILKYIPEKIILKKYKAFTVPRSLKFEFIKMRCKAFGQEMRLAEDGTNIFVESCEEKDIRDIQKISALKNEKVVISAINYENKKLYIDFRSNVVDFLEHDKIHIKAYANDKELTLEDVGCYGLIKSFGKTILKRKQYRVCVPVSKKRTDISFVLILNETEHVQNIEYGGANARLSNLYKKSYWNFDGDYILSSNGSKKYISIYQRSKLHRIGREVKLLAEIRKKKVDDNYKEMCQLRINYFRKKNSYKDKRIWVMFDKLYKGGDNGEYMYHYLASHPELGITPYYIINEDAPDYERLRNAGANLLITNSQKCREIVLRAEAILATHTMIWNYCGFSKEQQAYVSDLLNAKIVCIQHGLTVQQIAQYQNRLFDNTRFYCCASKYEIDNLLQPIYGYDEKDLVLTGLARYDGLHNNDKKQILITPTWRRDLVNNGIACKKKTHNAHFKDSMYFKVYNSFINNEKLIEVAKRTGYKLIYLLHPAMSSQSVDYDRNDYVQLVEATGDMSYEKILTESSLMVTDYSGVQFDFAYMRKPIVYYHPELLPPFYEEGVFVYDTMAFGEICTREDVLVEVLCQYMENNCITKPEFIKRADEFFAFDDHDSCQRIFVEVDKYLKRG